MSDNKNELLPVLEQIEKEKGIKKEEILRVVESALISAYKKHVGKDVNVEASVDPETTQVQAFLVKKVVEKVLNNKIEISLEDARKINPKIEINADLKIPLATNDFSRIAAQTAKQVIIQKIRESERSTLYDELKAKEGAVVSGVVFRLIGRNVIVDIGKTEGILPVKEQNPSERFRIGEHLKVFIAAVDKESRGPRVLLSRNRPEFVKKLFEMEVPEIYEKVVEIKQVVREPGVRSKVVVSSNNPKVDPVGACVGVKGARVKPIIDELRGERIDLVLFSSDPKTYINSAFSPAKILFVNMINPEIKKAEVIVSDDMLSLAIGKRGTNVNLVSKLTGWQIDVRSETQKKEQMKKKTVLSVEELTKLNGVGEKLAEVLHKSGWGDIEKLAQAKIENLIALQGIREKTAQKIIDAAKEYNASEKKEDLKEEKTQEQACEPVSIEEDKPEKKE